MKPINPRIKVLLNALPTPNTVWSDEDREVWIDLMRGVLADVYPSRIEALR